MSSPIPKTTAADAIWLAPGTDRPLPEMEELFADRWRGYSSGAWAQKHKKPHRGKSDFAKRAMEMNRKQEAILAEIREEGFTWYGGDAGGAYVPPFREVGRRTAVPEAHVIRRIVALTEAKPLTGRDKGVVRRQSRKESSLYDDMITLNRRVRGCIRADVDRTFPSWKHVYSWLTDLYRSGDIPCIPHLAVARRHIDGLIVKPHFLILLPYGDEVRFDRRCKGKARGLFRAVEAGWIRALGADRGGMSNSLKIKSVTSPKMVVGIFNQHDFLSLRDHAAVLDCSRFDDRKLAAIDSGMDQSRSNDIFTETRNLAWKKTLPRMVDIRDPRYPLWCNDRQLFADGLFEMLAPGAVAHWSGDKAPVAIEVVIRHVCNRIARDWDPSRASPPTDRGVMALPDDMPIEDKWDASGRWSSAKRLSETLDAMADEIERIERSGIAARKVDLINTDRWSKATINRRFDDAVLLSYYRSQPVAGKKEVDPCAPNYAGSIDMHCRESAVMKADQKFQSRVAFAKRDE